MELHCFDVVAAMRESVRIHDLLDVPLARQRVEEFGLLDADQREPFVQFRQQVLGGKVVFLHQRVLVLQVHVALERFRTPHATKVEQHEVRVESGPSFRRRESQVFGGGIVRLVMSMHGQGGSESGALCQRQAHDLARLEAIEMLVQFHHIRTEFDGRVDHDDAFQVLVVPLQDQRHHFSQNVILQHGQLELRYVDPHGVEHCVDDRVDGFDGEGEGAVGLSFRTAHDLFDDVDAVRIGQEVEVDRRRTVHHHPRDRVLCAALHKANEVNSSWRKRLGAATHKAAACGSLPTKMRLRPTWMVIPALCEAKCTWGGSMMALR